MRVCLLQRNAHIRRWFLATYAPHGTTVASLLLLPVSLAIAPGALAPRRRIAEKPPSALWDRSLPSSRAYPSVGRGSWPSLRQDRRVRWPRRGERVPDLCRRRVLFAQPRRSDRVPVCGV